AALGWSTLSVGGALRRSRRTGPQRRHSPELRVLRAHPWAGSDVVITSDLANGSLTCGRQFSVQPPGAGRHRRPTASQRAPVPGWEGSGTTAWYGVISG